MTNVPLSILLSIFVFVIFIVVAVIVVAVAIVALVTLDALTLSLVPHKIAVYPRYLRPMASASTSTDTTAWSVRDYPPPLGFTDGLVFPLRRRAGMFMGERGKKWGGYY